MTAQSEQKPRIAITMGDPAGIGPEILVKALSDPALVALARWIVVGDRQVLRWAEALTGLRLPAEDSAEIVDPNESTPARFTIGKMSAEAGRAALSYIRAAAEFCLQGRAAAMVTAPVNKEAVTLSGEEFTGHTEYIASLCGASESRMLLVNDHLRVVHVSTHVGLRKACDLDPDRILRTIELGREAVEWLGVDRPRIAVCGLNPHAGENGLFGDEDARFIIPAVEAARRGGISCDGPAPADTVFLRAVRGEYDLVVAMYHDQGHIPAKLLDFEHTVNVSLGLPIVRTSVDHGTAFDIAGKNLADPGSMMAAMRLASVMSSRQAGRGAAS
jgi:4-hydroxythreonine-4-phosphate dehydrogenase